MVAGALGFAAPASAQMYRWIDDQGSVHYTQGLDSVPDRFRAKAQMIALPEGPAAPASSSAPAGSAASTATKIPFTPGKPIMVTAKVNGGGSANLLLDTGASVTVINPRVLASMGIGSSGALRGSVQGATGSANVLFVPIQSIEVGNARSGPLRIAAHDVDLPQGDGLLGRDFLDQFTVSIDSTAGVVTIAPK
ncbi:MAG TPA: aspartyl protease family protein [Candidatus Bathyarchaeia archaeon]|nr:aspartyl protease family protein [Candidatus Bathyarchaeia archaeon]